MSVYKVWYAGKNPDYFEFIEADKAVLAGVKFVTADYDREASHKDGRPEEVERTQHELFVQKVNSKVAKVHGVIVTSQRKVMFIGVLQKVKHEESDSSELGKNS